MSTRCTHRVVWLLFVGGFGCSAVAKFDQRDYRGAADAGAMNDGAASDAATEPGDASADNRDAALFPTYDGDVPPRACADVATTPVRAVPTVMFLVDGSSSMRCVYPDDASCDCDGQIRKTCTAQGTQNRWQALTDALLGDGVQAGVIASLGGAIRFGLWTYNDDPTDVNGTCPAFPTKVDAALNNFAAIQTAFPADPPGYNTPTGLALGALSDALPNVVAAQQQGLGPQRVVLATDGQPFACVDRDTLDAPALDYAGVLVATDAAQAKGVDVYVMSLAPTAGDFATHLDEVAVKGNTGHAYAPADKDELAVALDEIISGAISCTVKLSGSIDSPAKCKGSAKLGDEMLACGDANGFEIVDAKHVALVGDACKRFKHEPGVDLQMTFPCDTFIPE